jgi:hypothetical protein
VSAPAKNQSIAGAFVRPGAATTEHYRRASEVLCPKTVTKSHARNAWENTLHFTWKSRRQLRPRRDSKGGGFVTNTAVVEDTASSSTGVAS